MLEQDDVADWNSRGRWFLEAGVLRDVFDLPDSVAPRRFLRIADSGDASAVENWVTAFKLGLPNAFLGAFGIDEHGVGSRVGAGLIKISAKGELPDDVGEVGHVRGRARLLIVIGRIRFIHNTLADQDD